VRPRHCGSRRHRRAPDPIDDPREALAAPGIRDAGHVPADRLRDGFAVRHLAIPEPERRPDADAHIPDRNNDPLLRRPGLVALGGDEPADRRAGMLDDVLAQLSGGLEELVHNLSVDAALEPFPDERGQALAALRIAEALQLEKGIAAVPFGDPGKAPADVDREGVDDGAEVHPGEPAPDVGMLREHQLDRQPVPGRGGDEAGKPGEGVGIDKAHPGEVDRGHASVDVERQDAVEMDSVQGGRSVGRHEREYRSSRNARPEPDDFCGYMVRVWPTGRCSRGGTARR
jgi:hypothetical protein